MKKNGKFRYSKNQYRNHDFSVMYTEIQTHSAKNVKINVAVDSDQPKSITENKSTMMGALSTFL